MKGDRLCKLLPLIKYVRARCLDLYQPVMELSVDERMVKSRACCHMVQYMKNKPTKFGFNSHSFFVLSVDTTFNLDDFYVTPTTYRHLMLADAQSGKHPAVIGPVLVHH